MEVISPGRLFAVESGGAKFTVAMMPGVVGVYNLLNRQFFNNPKNLPPNRLREIFPNEQAMKDAANIGRIGTLDRIQFDKSLEVLYNSKGVSLNEMNKIVELARNCKGRPASLREKIKSHGFAHVVDRLIFEDHNPELKATVDALKQFLEEIKNAP